MNGPLTEAEYRNSKSKTGAVFHRHAQGICSLPNFFEGSWTKRCRFWQENSKTQDIFHSIPPPPRSRMACACQWTKNGDSPLFASKVKRQRKMSSACWFQEPQNNHSDAHANLVWTSLNSAHAQSATVRLKWNNADHVICFEKQGDGGDRWGLSRNLIYSNWLKELEDSKPAPGMPQTGTCDWAVFCSWETRQKHSVVMAICFIFALLYPCLLFFWETQSQRWKCKTHCPKDGPHGTAVHPKHCRPTFQCRPNFKVRQIFTTDFSFLVILTLCFSPFPVVNTVIIPFFEINITLKLSSVL